MTKIWLTAIALAAVCAAHAGAQTESGPYVKGAIGYGMPNSLHIDLPTTVGKIDPAGNSREMLGIGHAFAGTNFRVDVDVVHRYANGGAVNDVSGSTDIQNYTLMLNGYYDVNRNGPVNPYIGAGFGASRLDVGISTALGGPVVNGEASNTAFGYQGIAGVGVALSNRLSADFEYRYVQLGDVRGPDFRFRDISTNDLFIGLRYALTPTAAPKPHAERPAPAPAPPVAPVAPRAAPVCQDVKFTVYFDWNEYGLTGPAAQTIAAAAQQAAACGISRVSVIGHTDRSGSAEYNVGLSERRAKTVRDELVRRGVAANAINVAGRGESEPAVDTPDGVREPQNRRAAVDITVSGGPSS
jgi:outer membrane protein OmpA-like peptidoglycan-associated protein/opacity protein-like surface antigen